MVRYLLDRQMQELMLDHKPRTVFEMEKGDEPVTFNGTSMEETNMDMEDRNRNRNEVFEKV